MSSLESVALGLFVLNFRLSPTLCIYAAKKVNFSDCGMLDLLGVDPENTTFTSTICSHVKFQSASFSTWNYTQGIACINGRHRIVLFLKIVLGGMFQSSVGPDFDWTIDIHLNLKYLPRLPPFAEATFIKQLSSTKYSGPTITVFEVSFK